MNPRRARQPLWYASLLHRLSGLALVLLLPFHFLVLGSAIGGAGALDRVLAWSAQPLVKFAELVLVFLLAVHLFGGLRLLALEFLPWQPRQQVLAALAVAGAFFVGCGVLLQAL